MTEIKIETGNEVKTEQGETFNATATDTATGSDTNAETDTDTVEVCDCVIEVCDCVTAVATLTGANYNTALANLDTYIAVYKAGDNMHKRGMAVKMIALALIERGALYTEKGYTSTVEMAEKEFGLTYATTKSYLLCAEKFYNAAQYEKTVDITDLVDNEGNFKKLNTHGFTSILADKDGNDFAPSAIESIRSLPVETITELMEKGELDYSMSSRDIRKAVQSYRKHKKAETNSDTATVETDIDTGSATDTDTDTGSATSTGNDTDTSSDTATEIEKLKAEIARLTAENKTLQAENDTLRNRAISAENKYKKLYNDTAAEKDEVMKLVTERDEAIIELNAENRRLKNSNNSYKAANSKAKTVNDTLKAENATLKAENDTLTAENATLKSSTGSDTDNSSDTDNGANAGNVTIVG